jgi:hypothetical protein
MIDRYVTPLKKVIKISKFDYVMLQGMLMEMKRKTEWLENLLDEIGNKNLEKPNKK